jgi:thiol-disulfide isomerase/thioredoxin
MSFSLKPVLAATLVAITNVANTQVPSDDLPVDADWRPKAEARILERLRSQNPGPLRCDFVLNSRAAFLAPVPGRATVLNFWRPSCEPCKPLLSELAELSKNEGAHVAVIAAAEGGSPLIPKPDLIALREQISGIVREHDVAFPVCGYTDHAQTKRWQAEGVPLTLFFDSDGRLGRVAMGAVEASFALKQIKQGWRP